MVAAGILAWVIWPEPEVEPRPREYKDATACLLTDGEGVAGAEAAAVWQEMQRVSAETSGQVRYLAVSGEQTVTNARSFAGTLILGRCSVIIATRGITGDAVRALAGAHQGQHFVVVGGDASSLSNVETVDVSGVGATVSGRLSADD